MLIDHFSQVWSSCAGAQKEGPAATGPGGKRAVGRGEGGMGGGEVSPFSQAVSLAFTCFTHLGPIKPFPSQRYVSTIQMKKLRCPHIS